MSSERLTEEQFIHQAIRNLRKGNYKGIHAVYSGFNSAFKEYFGKDPKEATARMVEEGKIQTRMVRGGPMFYLPGEMPTGEGVSDTISKITGGV